MRGKKLLLLLLCLCFLPMLTGCGREFDNYRPIEDVNNLEGRKIGVNLGWPTDYILTPRDGKDLILYRYDTSADMLMAMFYHQIDALCLDYLDVCVLENSNGDAVHRIEEPVATDGYLAFISSEREDLRDAFNQFLEYYHQTDEFSELHQRLMRFDGENYEPGEYIHPNGNGEKIKVAVDVSCFPYCYDEPDGTICGYDIEMMYAFADYFDYAIEFVATAYIDLQYGLTENRYDMGIGILSSTYIKDVEPMGIYWSNAYYEMPMYLIELVEGRKPVMLDEYYIAG